MKRLFIIAFALTSTAASLGTQAQTYQWKDANGRTIISDTPGPGSSKGPRSNPAQVPAPAQSAGTDKATDAMRPAPPQQKSIADLNLEFKKRQQDAKEKADKDAKEQAARAENQENCERARRALTALQNGQPMALLNEKGESQLMDNSQREQELERARRFVAESCR